MKNIMENITEEQSSLIKKMSGLGYTYVYDKDISEEGFLAWKESRPDGSTVTFGIDGWEAVDDLIQHTDKLCETYSLKELQDRADGNYNVIEYGDYRDSEVRGAIYKLEHNTVVNNNPTLEELKSSLLKIQQAASAALIGIDKELAYIKDSRIQAKQEKNELEDNAFSGRLHRFLSNSQSSPDALFISSTPYALAISGANPLLDVVITQKTIKKCMSDAASYHHGHNLSEEIIRQLPQELRNPVMIFKGSTPNSLALISDLEDSNHHGIIIATHINEHGTHQEVNRVASMYGKNNISNYLKNQLAQGNLIAANVKKAVAMLRIAAPGLQLPPEDTYIRYDDRIVTSMENIRYPLMAVTEAAATQESPEASPKQTVDSALDAFKKELADCGFQCTTGLADNYRELIHSGMNMTLGELSDAYRAGNSTINGKIMELVKNEDFASIEEFKEEIGNDRKAVADYLKWRSEAGHFKNEGITREYVEACKSLLADYYINAIGEELAEQELMQQPPDPDIEIQE